MADVTWPSTLPLPEARNYRFVHGDVVVLFEPEVGPPKARPRGAMASDRIAMSLLVDVAGRDTFRAFYRRTTKRGTVPFEMEEPGGGELADWIFVDAPEEEAFAGGAFWRIRFTLARVA